MSYPHPIRPAIRTRMTAMSDLESSSKSAAAPDRVRIYGNDHSPWVQAVLLALHDQRIEHTIELAPPLSLFLESGILMPAARIDAAPWLLDSERILCGLGYSPVSEDDRSGLQRIFGGGARRRADHVPTFFQRFGRVRAGEGSLPRRLWQQFWRSFSMFYFFVILNVLARRLERPGPDRIAADFQRFQDRLTPDTEFIAGTSPDTVDLQFFGIVQMCASIPGPSFEVLRTDPKLDRLRRWVSAMQTRFADYDHLYTADAFEPRQPEIRPSPASERVAYWFGLTTMFLAFPVTLPLVVYFASRIRRKGLL